MQMLRIALLCGLCLLASAPRALAEDWGTIKCQAVCSDPRALTPKRIESGGRFKDLLRNAPIYSERYVVNPKTKGVRWVVVWLAKDAGGKADHDAALPIHSDLRAIKHKDATMAPAHYRFEPHVLALRKGQDFVVKDSPNIIDNVIVASRKGRLGNSTGPEAGFRIAADRWKPDSLPAFVCSAIYPWMQSYVFCFAHPSFAVTDEHGRFEIKNAPAGKYRLIAWHEGMGWVTGDRTPNKNGKLITIKAGQVTDVGKLTVKYND